MKVLVLNSGSSSIKFSLFENENLLIKGLVEKIGEQTSRFKYTINEEVIQELNIADHNQAIELVLKNLISVNVIDSYEELNAVGHRVVHGGENFSDSVLITDEVKGAIKQCFEVAPLHNPPNFEGILACEKLLPGAKQVAVFDTSFHQTLPKESYFYALPYEYYEKYRIRRYGFHGTSHKFVANKAAEILGRNIGELKLITCHMGNGDSIAAVDKGKSIETSMGFTPLEGLVMGTRSGDIDPAIFGFLMEKEGLSAKDVDNLLNKKSGLIGLSGIGNDMRDLIASEDERAKLAVGVYCHRLMKYIGAYISVLNGVDAIIFTAGIGENVPLIRKKIMSHFSYLGVGIDDGKNDNHETIISTDDSHVKVMVVPTDEELMIAQDTVRIVNG